MANPYRDEAGKFCSRAGMEAAVTRLASSGKVAEYLKLRQELDVIDSEQPNLGEVLASMETHAPSDFTAYDKVHFSQYPLYEQYAKSAPGEENFSIAENIFYASREDEAVTAVNGELRRITDSGSYVPSEHRLFAIRDASGDSFDVYLMDEDRLFVSHVPHVHRDNVVTAGLTLAQAGKTK